MKKIIICLMTAMLSLTFNSNATTAIAPVTASAAIAKPAVVPDAEAQSMLNRLNEIKAMDVSKLNSSEKKQLRKEVRSIRERLRHHSGGIYISFGAIIIILLLIILL